MANRDRAAAALEQLQQKLTLIANNIDFAGQQLAAINSRDDLPATSPKTAQMRLGAKRLRQYYQFRQAPLLQQFTEQQQQLKTIQQLLDATQTIDSTQKLVNQRIIESCQLAIQRQQKILANLEQQQEVLDEALAPMELTDAVTTLLEDNEVVSADDFITALQTKIDGGSSTISRAVRRIRGTSLTVTDDSKRQLDEALSTLRDTKHQLVTDTRISWLEDRKTEAMTAYSQAVACYRQQQQQISSQLQAAVDSQKTNNAAPARRRVNSPITKNAVSLAVTEKDITLAKDCVNRLTEFEKKLQPTSPTANLEFLTTASTAVRQSRCRSQQLSAAFQLRLLDNLGSTKLIDRLLTVWRSLSERLRTILGTKSTIKTSPSVAATAALGQLNQHVADQVGAIAMLGNELPFVTGLTP